MQAAKTRAIADSGQRDSFGTLDALLTDTREMLDGYPVRDLIDPCLHALETGSLGAARAAAAVLDHTVASWIATLSSAIREYLRADTDIMKGLRQRLQGTRDALITLQREFATVRRLLGDAATHRDDAPLQDRTRAAGHGTTGRRLKRLGMARRAPSTTPSTRADRDAGRQRHRAAGHWCARAGAVAVPLGHKHRR